MTNILYRESITAAVPTGTSAKNTPLTNIEIDGNFKSLSNDVGTKEVSANKDASGGYVGLTLYKIDMKNVANTFTSFLTNINTASRTYTFQDRDGTIVDNTDLALKAPLLNAALTGTPTAPTATPGTNTTQLGTTEFTVAAVAVVQGNLTTLDTTVSGHTTSINNNTTSINNNTTNIATNTTNIATNTTSINNNTSVLSLYLASNFGGF